MPLNATNVLWANTSGNVIYYQPFFPFEWYVVIMGVAVLLFIMSHTMRRGTDVAAGLAFMFGVVASWMTTTVSSFVEPMYNSTELLVNVQVYASTPMTIAHLVFTIVLFLNIIYVIVENRREEGIISDSAGTVMKSPSTDYNSKERVL